MKRAEAVSMLNAVLERTPDQSLIDEKATQYPMPFPDVPKEHWAYYDILEATVKHESADFHKPQEK